jgi:hypothetical protein
MQPNYLNKLSPQKYMCEKHLYNLDKYERDVAELSAELFEIPTWVIFAKTRWQKSIDARKAMSLVFREKTNKTLTQIGDILSVAGYDHTTILHAVQTGVNLYDTDDAFKAKVDKMFEVINDIKLNVLIKSTSNMKIPAITSLQALAMVG